MKISMIVLALLIGLFDPRPATSNTDVGVLQETCGKNAEEFYRSKYENSFEKGTTSYRPYYNKALNKCFVSISIHGYRKNNVKVDSLYTALYDLGAGKELGSFFQVYGSRSEQYPHCITPEKPVSKCSPDDWDALMRRTLQE